MATTIASALPPPSALATTIASASATTITAANATTIASTIATATALTTPLAYALAYTNSITTVSPAARPLRLDEDWQRHLSGLLCQVAFAHGTGLLRYFVGGK